MIRFACPGCQATFSVDDTKAGKAGKCPKCQAQFVIPELGAAAPPPAAASQAVPPPLPPQPMPTVAPGASVPVEIDPCPKCQTKLSVMTSDLGSSVECPYCKTVFTATKSGTRPSPALAPAPSKEFDFGTKSKPKRKSDEDDEEEDRPRRRRGQEDDDDEDRSARKKKMWDEEDEERPSRKAKSSRRDRDDEDDEDERPSRRGRAAARRDDDDDDERPSRRRGSRRDEDDEDDRRDYQSRSRRGRGRGGRAPHSGMVTAVGVMTIVLSVLWLISAGAIFLGSAFLASALQGVPINAQNPQQAQDARRAVQGVAVWMGICCGVPTLLLSALHGLGGVFTLQRKSAGRVMVIICAVLAILAGLLQLFGLITALNGPRAESMNLGITAAFMLFTLGYGIFAMIVMCRSDVAEEFN